MFSMQHYASVPPNAYQKHLMKCKSQARRRTMLQAKIHPYFPYFHVDVAALVFMFQPVLSASISEHHLSAMWANS